MSAPAAGLSKLFSQTRLLCFSGRKSAASTNTPVRLCHPTESKLAAVHTHTPTPKPNNPNTKSRPSSRTNTKKAMHPSIRCSRSRSTSSFSFTPIRRTNVRSLKTQGARGLHQLLTQSQEKQIRVYTQETRKRTRGVSALKTRPAPTKTSDRKSVV